jgi:hypothetical protein
MFKALLDNNYEAELQAEATPYIISEREQYTDIIFYILNFTKKHNMVVSNIDILLGTQKYWNVIEIYTLNIDDLVKGLVMQLCSKFEKLFLLKIFELNKEYFIEYNLRKLCTIYTIKPYKTMTLYDFINPPVYMINADLSIYLMPQIVEIIFLYKNLHDPSIASSWEDVYKMIKKVGVLVNKELNEIIRLPKKDLLLKLSSSEFISNETDSETKAETDAEINSKCCKDKRTEKIIDIKTLLVDFFKDSHFILTSEEIFDSTSDDNAEISVISINVEEDHKLLVNYLSRFIDYGISYKKKSLYLPKEDQMEKYNFYLEIPFIKNIKKKHFLTIYNNMSYELINSYEKNGYKYADPIVQVRLMYISIWNLLVLQKAHGLRYDIFIEHVKRKLDTINAVKEKIDIYELKKNYEGIFLPLNISKKMQLINSYEKKSFYCFDF